MVINKDNSELVEEISRKFSQMCNKINCEECQYNLQQDCKILFALNYMDKRRERFHSDLRTIRVSKGLTQTELASLIGITREYLSKFENHKKMPSKNIKEKISVILGINKSEIDW